MKVNIEKGWFRGTETDSLRSLCEYDGSFSLEYIIGRMELNSIPPPFFPPCHKILYFEPPTLEPKYSFTLQEAKRILKLNQL